MVVLDHQVVICQRDNPEDFAGFWPQCVVHSGLDVLAGNPNTERSPSGWTRRLLILQT